MGQEESRVGIYFFFAARVAHVGRRRNPLSASGQFSIKHELVLKNVLCSINSTKLKNVGPTNNKLKIDPMTVSGARQRPLIEGRLGSRPFSASGQVSIKRDFSFLF